MKGAKQSKLRAQFNKQIAGLEADILLLNSKLNETADALVNKKKHLRLVQQRVNKLNLLSDEVAITDHAIVRYLERVNGLDLTNIRNAYLKNIPPDMKNGTVKIDGHTAVIHIGVVVTIK